MSIAAQIPKLNKINAFVSKRDLIVGKTKEPGNNQEDVKKAFNSGVVEIGKARIRFDDKDTLEKIVDKINKQEKQSKIKANIVGSRLTGFRIQLILKSNESQIIIKDKQNVLSNLMSRKLIGSDSKCSLQFVGNNRKVIVIYRGTSEENIKKPLGVLQNLDKILKKPHSPSPNPPNSQNLLISLNDLDNFMQEDNIQIEATEELVDQSFSEMESTISYNNQLKTEFIGQEKIDFALKKNIIHPLSFHTISREVEENLDEELIDQNVIEIYNYNVIKTRKSSLSSHYGDDVSTIESKILNPTKDIVLQTLKSAVDIKDLDKMPENMKDNLVHILGTSLAYSNGNTDLNLRADFIKNNSFKIKDELRQKLQDARQETSFWEKIRNVKKPLFSELKIAEIAKWLKNI